MQITSSRSRLYLIVNLAASLCIVVMGLAMLFIFYKMHLENRVENKTYFLILFAVFTFGVAVNLLYTYFKNAKKIFVDAQKIRIAQKEFLWKDMEDVKFSGKKSFGFFNFQLEAAELKFRNAERFYIFENIYSNGPEIKSFIKSAIVEKNDSIPAVKPISERELLGEISKPIREAHSFRCVESCFGD